MNEEAVRLDERLKILAKIQEIIYEEVLKTERTIPIIKWRMVDARVANAGLNIEAQILKLL